MIAFRGGCSRAEVGEKAFGRVAFAVVLRGTIVAVKGFGGERKHLFQRWMQHCADKRLMRGGLTAVSYVGRMSTASKGRKGRRRGHSD